MTRASLFKSIKVQQYKELLPKFQEERTQAFTTLILSFIALSFFGFFAISPTLSKITELHKQLEDNIFTDEKLTEKINNLGMLYQKYNAITPELPVIYAAIPEKPEATTLLGQLQTISKRQEVNLTKLNTFQVELSKTDDGISKYSSFAFSLDAEGSYDQLLAFASALGKFERIISIDSITINASTNQEKSLVVNIRGKAYFKK